MKWVGWWGKVFLAGFDGGGWEKGGGGGGRNSWGAFKGVGKVEPGPKLFFLVSAPTQLSAYANHELKNYIAKVARR